MLGVGLLSLVFLGSPGCGCGDDDLTPTDPGGPGRCCCDFEWLAPRTALGSDVAITIENADVSLDAEVTPALLPNVSFTVPEQFTVCVNEEHLLGPSLDLVFRDDATNVEYGRAALIYDVRCRPVIELISSGMDLVSTNCGGGQPLQCCCEFEWLPSWQDGDLIDVTITAENVSAGLNPVITPTAITDVAEGEIELIDICVDVNHPLGAQMDLVVTEQPGGFIVGVVRLVYDEQCVPTVVPLAAVATLDITSTECGGPSLFCCCDFDWLPGRNMTGDVVLTVVNKSDDLTVQITPSTLTGVGPTVFESFQICVNASHQLLDSFDLVISSTAGPELGRARITYRERCVPDVADVPGFGSLSLTSTDCGGAPIQCCCDIEWFAPTAWNPPPGPWSASLENVDASLQVATITPTTIDVALAIPPSVLFTVCVNPVHDLNATMDIVLRASGGVEFARFPLIYLSQCLPSGGDPSGEGFWNIVCQGPNKPGR